MRSAFTMLLFGMIVHHLGRFDKTKVLRQAGRRERLAYGRGLGTLPREWILNQSVLLHLSEGKV